MNKLHTFAICAYKESPYLEKCIESLLNQNVKSQVILCTSTPNKYIKDIVNKHNIPYYINNKQLGIGGDWNFAYSKATTQLVTIAHQDDIYFPKYAELIIEEAKKSKRPIILYTAYKELRNEQMVKNNRLLIIKNILNSPLKFKILQSKKYVRKFILAFGNSICCPAVTLNKMIIGKNPFDIKLKNSLDWEAWLRFAKHKGEYIYINEHLMAHRISEISETTNTIASGVRAKEDYEIFRKIWPAFIAKIIMKFYSRSMDSNKI